MIYSFNASRLVTVWGGWSTRWYSEFFNDRAMLEAASVSLRIAFLSATAATVLGTLAALALARGGRFRGRLLFSGMVYAPLVMPEVITGLSLLLLFVAVDVDRGFWTITIAHTTLTLCFVTVVVQSRLVTFDRSLEEAAMDLGCPPLRTFLTVTLPLIGPAVASGWMLAFTLSLDDLVIASFVTGPGATTLPIRIYSEVRLGVKPEINAVCTIMIAVVATGLVAASLLTKRRARARAAAPLGARFLIDSFFAARARRAEQVDQEPHRHDDERAEQEVRQRPGEALPQQLDQPLRRDAEILQHLVGRDAEMRQDRADDQRRDRDLDQRAEGADHAPRPPARGCACSVDGAMIGWLS